MAKTAYDEATPEELAEKERHAAALLDNPVFNDALAAIEEECLHEFRISQYHNVDARERAWALIQATDQLRRSVRAWISTGETQDIPAKFIDGRKKK